MVDVSQTDTTSAFVLSTTANGCSPPIQYSGTSTNITSFTESATPLTDPRNFMTVVINASGVAAATYRLCVRWTTTSSYSDSGVPISIGTCSHSCFVSNMRLHFRLVSATSVSPTVLTGVFNQRIAIIGTNILTVIGDPYAVFLTSSSSCSGSPVALVYAQSVAWSSSTKTLVTFADLSMLAPNTKYNVCIRFSPSSAYLLPGQISLGVCCIAADVDSNSAFFCFCQRSCQPVCILAFLTMSVLA